MALQQLASILSFSLLLAKQSGANRRGAGREGGLTGAEGQKNLSRWESERKREVRIEWREGREGREVGGGEDD